MNNNNQLYPNFYENILVVRPNEHTMQNALLPYIEMKIPSLLKTDTSSEIVVRGKFDRTHGGDSIEKSGKIFNYMRPTVEKEGNIIYLNCFPGVDYVFHYSNLVSSYFEGTGRKVSAAYPSEKECWDALYKSSLMSIPVPSTVIMGYVEGMDVLSNDKTWRGEGTFLWKKCDRLGTDAILLGCKHSYWGEVSMRVAFILAAKGCKKLIYVGKLGTLLPEVTPNCFLATGNRSLMPDGTIIEWTNLFNDNVSPIVIKGNHLTLPSVIQETKHLAQSVRGNISFVDSEIGYMAYAANRNDMDFSYLHIISDNLVAPYQHNLSNERSVDVRRKRQYLYKETVAQIRLLFGGSYERRNIS